MAQEQIWDGSTDGDWSTGANWESGNAPGNGDSVRIPAGVTQGIDGYDASGTTLVGFTVENTSITIGSKTTPLHITLYDSSTAYDAILEGTGETHLQIDDYENIVVRDAATSPGTGEYGLNLSGALDDTNTPAASGNIIILAGANASIGLGSEAGTDLELNDLKVTGGSVTVGSSVTEDDGSTAPDMSMTGGTAETHSALGTVSQTGGTWRHHSGAVTTMNVDGGKCHYRSTGTASTVTVANSGQVLCTEDIRGRTFSALTMYSGATFKDPMESVTLTNDIDLTRCGLSDVTLELGNHIKLSRGEIT
ncbi:MAG: hypothetical protein KGY99_10645 [Phycisphaerae bacterium]|nr:hypothetical protein [Phycisphaerae bacterium]